MVLATLFIAGILILLFSDARSLVRPTYTIHMHFTDAPGVTEGTPVRKSGILIGRVTKVEFADQGGVNVTAAIDRHVALYRNEIPQVTGSLLGGDVVIQFVRKSNLPPKQQPPPSAASSPSDPAVKFAATQVEPKKTVTPKAAAENQNQLVQPDEWIEGAVAPNAFQVFANLETELGRAVGSLSDAGDEVSKLAARVNTLLEGNEEHINSIVKKTEKTLDVFQRSLENFDDVFGDEQVRGKLKDAIAGLPDLLGETRSAMSTIKTTVESVDRNLHNLEGLTGPLGERGEQIVNRADQTIARLDDLLGELSDFGRKLNSGEGSLGKIMRDPDLYQHLNGAAKNIERITCELQPIVRDARVFADKIARHPELLGVRGAIQKLRTARKITPARRGYFGIASMR
jgi:phospholipid/cholesterol/gamma-HCH transport system substrate-binding protein